MGLLVGKFRQLLTELSVHDTSVFSFPDDEFSKYQWIFTKLYICIAIVKIWLGLVMSKFQFLTELSARDTFVFSFPDDDFSK